MILIEPDSELAQLLCKLFRGTAVKRIQYDDMEQRAWIINFSYAHYESQCPSTAFCEIQGTPAKGQLCFDFDNIKPAPLLAAGSMYRMSFVTKRCPAKLLETHRRAKELLLELSNQN